MVSTFAGSGVKGILDEADTVAEFCAPYDIVIDKNGNLYVSEVTYNCIRKIIPTGVVSTFAGSGVAGNVNGQGRAAQFNQPAGLAIDVDGNIYVADYGNNCIRKITPSGFVSLFSGNGTPAHIDGPGTGAEFSSPLGVAVDKNNNLYVTEYTWHNRL